MPIGDMQYCQEAVYYEADDYSEFLKYDIDEKLCEDELVLMVAMNDQEGFKDDFIAKNLKYYVEKSFQHGYSSAYHLKTRD